MCTTHKHKGKSEIEFRVCKLEGEPQNHSATNISCPIYILTCVMWWKTFQQPQYVSK